MRFHKSVRFPVSLLLLSSHFIALEAEKILRMRFIFENILRLNLWPNISSILENVPWALEKNVYVVAIESSVLPESVRPGWIVVFLPLFLCVYSVCLLYPLLGEEGC